MDKITLELLQKIVGKKEPRTFEKPSEKVLNILHDCAVAYRRGVETRRKERKK